MSMVRALRMLAAVENGTLNAASLETLLAGSQARKDELRQLLSTRSLFDRIAASKNTCDALVGSSNAVSILTGTLPYQSELFTALFKTVAGKTMFHGSDTLLNFLQSTASVLALARAAAGYSAFTKTSNGTTPVSLSPDIFGGAYILLGMGSAASGTTATVSTKRSGSGISNTVSVPNVASATGIDLSIPLVSSYSFVLDGLGSSAYYFGVLRCGV